MSYVNYILSLSFALLLTSGNIQNNNVELPEYNNETMHYIVKYGIFTIGKAVILFQYDSLSGEYFIKAEVRSAGLIKLIKRLDYIYESYMDPQTGLPLNFMMYLKDNRNYFYNKLVFDRHSRDDSTIVQSHLSGAHVVSKDLHDILTGFYLFRQNHLLEIAEDQQDIVIKAFFPDELWDLRIRYAGKEKINTMFGKINCLVFKPVTVIGGFFKNDDDMTAWFSDDANHIPVRIKLNLTIGSIDGYLVDYQKNRKKQE